MEVLRTAKDLVRLYERDRAEGPLVLVPTMGALHEGHLSLVRTAKGAGPVVVSIFVNPTQFGPTEDLAAYPRDLASDLALLEPLGVHTVFAPDVSEVYSAGGEVTVQPGDRGQGLCGGDRPGHFSGVLTVVAKLFGMIRPDIAIFGRKDAQQCLVIGQMVEDLRLPVRLVDLPTVREVDGLALSSRNRYLDTTHRQQALCLSGALLRAKELIIAGERSADRVQNAMKDILAAADMVEYAEIRQVPQLAEMTKLSGKVLLAVAARVGPARLIDNLVLDLSGGEVRESCLLGSL